ncbi:MAG TPA: phosphatidylserine decarboxylase family protein [Alphaproteobacteria bacterium]|nr:phosphatidylserine decarboxylase family protein [Alphaproteobacteria bacterium]
MKNIDISLAKYIFPNINQDGWKFVSIFAVVTALLGLLWAPLGVVGIVLTVWCYYFFRDPDRVTPDIKDVVVSPADGVVQMITRVTGPEELGLNNKTYNRISIFMSVFNVHVNRAPATGEILKTTYVKGKFFNATLDKASKDNERQLLSMKTSSGKTIAFVQIAGLVARRIICLAKAGDKFEGGQRFGWIRFGSRLDVYLPTDVEPLVCVGQTMIAGETILANLSADKQERPQGVVR